MLTVARAPQLTVISKYLSIMILNSFIPRRPFLNQQNETSLKFK